MAAELEPLKAPLLSKEETWMGQNGLNCYMLPFFGRIYGISGLL
jgi:hypothetical protein